MIFLHQLTEGVAESSYGIEVAKMAGLTQSVINSSKKVIFISWDEPIKSTYKKIKIHNVENQKQCEDFIMEKSKSKDDFLVSSYWPWKFSKKIVDKFNKNSIKKRTRKRNEK